MRIELTTALVIQMKIEKGVLPKSLLVSSGVAALRKLSERRIPSENEHPALHRSAATTGNTIWATAPQDVTRSVELQLRNRQAVIIPLGVTNSII